MTCTYVDNTSARAMVITIASLEILDKTINEQERRKENGIRGGGLRNLWKYEGQQRLGLFRLGI
jgi:hypothetical protein